MLVLVVVVEQPAAAAEGSREHTPVVWSTAHRCSPTESAEGTSVAVEAPMMLVEALLVLVLETLEAVERVAWAVAARTRYFLPLALTAAAGLEAEAEHYH